MNKHVLPEQLNAPSLTPGERIETLIDAIALHEVKRLASFRHAKDIGWDACVDISAEDEIKLDQLVDEEIRSREAIVAIARTLMRDDLLERCVQLLQAEQPKSQSGQI